MEMTKEWQLWRLLERAVLRRDAFALAFYLHQLSTVRNEQALALEEPVIQYGE